MQIFISYAQKDQALADTVRRDLTRARASVWIDDELTGGQAWWETILENIRTCDVFVFLLSANSLQSKACQAELRYAVECRRPLLPVKVAQVSLQLAPRAIADTQIVDYTERTADSAVALLTAVQTQPTAPPPDPAPDAPPPPFSYMNPYREQIQAEALSYREQAELVFALRGHLQFEEERDTAKDLLTELRRRPDIAESVGRDIDALLPIGRDADRVAPAAPRATLQDVAPRQEQTAHVPRTATASAPRTASRNAPSSAPIPHPASSAPSGPPIAAGRRPDPTGRYQDRSAERVAGSPPSPSPGQEPQGRAFSGGAMIGLLLATLILGPVGVIVGAMNLKRPGRRRQSRVLLWVGIAWSVIQVVYFVVTMVQLFYYFTQYR